MWILLQRGAFVRSPAGISIISPLLQLHTRLETPTPPFSSALRFDEIEIPGKRQPVASPAFHKTTPSLPPNHSPLNKCHMHN